MPCARSTNKRRSLRCLDIGSEWSGGAGCSVVAAVGRPSKALRFSDGGADAVNSRICTFARTEHSGAGGPEAKRNGRIGSTLGDTPCKREGAASSPATTMLYASILDENRIRQA